MPRDSKPQLPTPCGLNLGTHQASVAIASVSIRSAEDRVVLTPKPKVSGSNQLGRAGFLLKGSEFRHGPCQNCPGPPEASCQTTTKVIDTKECSVTGTRICDTGLKGTLKLYQRDNAGTRVDGLATVELTPDICTYDISYHRL